MATRDESGSSDAEAFGPYLVRERLGVGGMATVHRAVERGIEGFERSVALKRLLPHLAEDEKFVRAFVREAKLASMLTHPHVVQIFELGRVGPVYFISMELIEGHDVRKMLRQSRKVTGPPPISVVVSVLAQICDALEYAHNRADERGNPLGLVHRDVSPSNLLITHGGHVKVIDFGIAKATVGHLRTQTGHVKGKMAYMSPEAIGGKELDSRSDLFSLGVVAHELVTARPLFATKNEYQTLLRVQKAAIAPPSTYNQNCPPELDAIIMRALERSCDTRWASATDMREQLADLILRYNLNAGPRVVGDWMEWAFAMGDAARGELSGKITMTTGTPARPTPRPFAGVAQPAPVFFTRGERDTPNTGLIGGASLPPAEEDDEVVEIAWGGRAESPVPVLIEGITDYSGGAASMEAVPRQQHTLIAVPPPATRLPTSAGKTLIGYRPEPQADPQDDDEDEDLRLERPATTVTPAKGSGAHRAIPMPPPRVAPAPEPEPLPLPVPPRPPELPTLLAEPAALPEPPLGPVVNFKAPAATMPQAAASTALATRTPAVRADSEPTRPTTVASLDIGASIIARQQKRFPVLAIALIAGAATTAGVATYVLLRNEPLPAATPTDEPAAPASAAPAAAPAPEVRPARLVVRSTPPGMEVSIDGLLVEGVTPIAVEVTAGRHLVAVEADGEVLWRQELDVLAASHFELHPVVVAPSGRSERDRKRDRARYQAPTLAAPEQSGAPIDNQLAQTTAPLTPLAPPAPPAATFPAPAAMPPANVVPPPAKRAPKPVLIPPNAVSKRSGSVPTLRARAGNDIPRLISATLCINDRGRVTSATLLTQVPEEISGTLTAALRRWRYSPYRDPTGTRLPACFAVNFKAR